MTIRLIFSYLLPNDWMAVRFVANLLLCKMLTLCSVFYGP